MNKTLSILIGSSALAVVGLLSGMGMQSAGAVTLVTRTFSGNDCAGYFGANFEVCNIFINDNNRRIELSPVIAKFETFGENQQLPPTATEINPLYPTIDGSEWTFEEVDPNESKTGTWSYDPGEGDPGIKYWSVKAGTSFNLFWYVEDEVAQPGGVCAGDPYNLGCLQNALEVTSGTWATPESKGLSHIVFYNTKPPHQIPEPGTIVGLGLFTLASLGLSKKSSKG